MEEHGRVPDFTYDKLKAITRHEYIWDSARLSASLSKRAFCAVGLFSSGYGTLTTEPGLIVYGTTLIASAVVLHKKLEPVAKAKHLLAEVETYRYTVALNEQDDRFGEIDDQGDN